ncbi:MAG: aminopeptidase P family protein [Chloroflexi bacterium]|nr:aminopeptidase P family protein [Chloroflexota bacterium]
MQPSQAAAAFRPKILPLRQQMVVQNDWLKQRLETLLPQLMAREGLDMWIVVAREYNEDPVIMTLLPEPEMAARRRTILVFTRQEDGTVERLTLSRYGMAGFYETGWDPTKEDQLACLARTVRERNPASIGLNWSSTFPFGDGISHHEYQRVAEALGEDVMARTQSAERLCVGWLEWRIPDELVVYPGLIEMGHAIIAEAFSFRVIQPGITTTDDVVWWMRQTMLDLGFKAWFQPTVEIQSHGSHFEDYSKRKPQHRVIMPGDLLHCDMGFTYLGLTTDQQQHGYVLKPGESDAPEGLKAALAAGNRLQDIHMEEMKVGRTGNEVLKAALDRAKAEGITPQIYSHPIGFHGHAAGPTIGLWDQQGGVSGPGDYELFDDTCYSIELNVKHSVPDWDGQEVRIALEEEAVLTDSRMHWLHGRQTQFHLIG